MQQPTVSLNDLPLETLQLIAHHVIDADNANAWIPLAGVCSAMRQAVVNMVLSAHLPICSRAFDAKIDALERINVANLATLVLHLGRTSWLTTDELSKVTSNFAHLQRGRPFTAMHAHVLTALRHLTIESLSRRMWCVTSAHRHHHLCLHRMRDVHHIATTCTALHTLHIPLALGSMQPAIATLAAHIPGLRRLRLDVKPGGPPSATDNLVLHWPALQELHVEYDWTKDDLEYAPCLRLETDGCPSLHALRVVAVDKPANLLALRLPPDVRQVRWHHACMRVVAHVAHVQSTAGVGVRACGAVMLDKHAAVPRAACRQQPGVPQGWPRGGCGAQHRAARVASGRA